MKYNNQIISANNIINSIFRINQEFDELKHGLCVGLVCDIGFKLFLKNNNNPYEWIFTLNGLNYTPYSGGKFYLKILFPLDFPKRAPEFCFVTPIYHVNVNHIKQPNYKLGHIDTFILIRWKPTTKIKEVILDILSLFFTGNPDSPFGLEIADLFKNNRQLFDNRVRYFTRKYANPSMPYKEYDSWDFSVPNEIK